MQFPEEMRGEVEKYFSNGRTIKETEVPIRQLGESNGNNNIFIARIVYNHAIRELR